jgi:hypothetical protein
LVPGLEGFLRSTEDIFGVARRIVGVVRILDTPAKVRFIVVRHRNPKTGDWIKMPQSLLNDQIANIPLEFDNLVGQKVAPPNAGTITLTLTNTADGTPFAGATAAMGADGTSVDVTPVPADGTNMGVFTLGFEDVANADLKASLDCNFTSDPNAANVHFVTTGITERPVGP